MPLLELVQTEWIDALQIQSTDINSKLPRSISVDSSEPHYAVSQRQLPAG